VKVRGFEPLLHRDDLHAGIQGRERGLGGLDLGRTDAAGAVEDLALQVGEVYFVRVDERELADAARGQVERRGAAQAARADDERVRIAQPLLPLDPDFGEQDVAAVAEELLVVQAGRRISSAWSQAWRQARRRPRAAGP
jgi:hypothetical protein